MFDSVKFGIVAAAMAVSIPTASADPARCTCEVSGDSREIGAITSVTGNALVTSEAGYVPATQGSPLVRNSAVMIGPQSKATFAIAGGCSIEAVENTTVSIGSRGKAICVVVSKAGAVTFDSATTEAGYPYIASGNLTNGGAPFGGPPLWLFTGLAGTAALLSFTQDSDDGPAPVSQ